MLHRGFLLAGLMILGVVAPVGAQSRLGGLISADTAHRHGLKLAWHTQLDVNRANGRVAFITQHVSETSYIEVRVADLVYRYHFRDVDELGLTIGKEGAEARAAAKMADLEASELKPVAKTFSQAEVSLYVVTDRGLLHAINGETGEIRWTQLVGNPDFPTTAPAASDTHVAVCNGSHVYVYDRITGKELWRRETSTAISAGPAISSQMVSVPTARGGMETYKLDQTKRTAPHIYRSQGLIYRQPIATARSIAWTTERGHMYCADAASGRARFRLEASDTIVGGMAFLAPRYFYGASFDGYVYCIDELNGAVAWRYSTGSIISQTPVAVGETVYVVTDEHELHALDYRTGQLAEIKPPLSATATLPPAPRKPTDPPPDRVQVVTGIHGIIAVTPTRVYCTGRHGQMVILNAANLSRVGTMVIGNQDIVLHNSVTDRLILGTSTGTLQCLHETKLETPYVHEVELEKLRGKRPDIIQETGEEPAPMMEEPGKTRPKPADPFGDKDADPFGEKPVPPKEEKPKKEDDNPFG